MEIIKAKKQEPKQIIQPEQKDEVVYKQENGSKLYGFSQTDMEANTKAIYEMMLIVEEQTKILRRGFYAFLAVFFCMWATYLYVILFL